MRRILLLTLTLLALAVGVSAASTTYTYNGTGTRATGYSNLWKLAEPGIGISPNGFTFYFTEQAGYDHMAAGAQTTLSNFNRSTGLPFVLSGTIGSPTGAVQNGTVAVHYSYRPCHGSETLSTYADYAGTGTAWVSCTWYYKDPAGNIVSAAIWFDDEYWQSGSGYDSDMTRNLFAHESGHAMGLAHPNSGGDWTCGKNDNGVYPVMCSPGTRGFTGSWSGQMTQWDWNGLMDVALNGALRVAGIDPTIRRLPSRG
jgi:hypothetical protein